MAKIKFIIIYIFYSLSFYSQNSKINFSHQYNFQNVISELNSNNKNVTIKNKLSPSGSFGVGIQKDYRNHTMATLVNLAIDNSTFEILNIPNNVYDKLSINTFYIKTQLILGLKLSSKQRLSLLGSLCYNFESKIFLENDKTKGSITPEGLTSPTNSRWNSIIGLQYGFKPNPSKKFTAIISIETSLNQKKILFSSGNYTLNKQENSIYYHNLYLVIGAHF